MNIIWKRILIGALAVIIPAGVGGSIYYFATNGSSNNSASEQENIDDDTNKDKKNDNEKHPGTDAKVDNPHKDNINKLKEEYNNDEVVGVLSIPDTSINTVVVQHDDNSYYLDHNARGEETVEGAAYLDYRVDINSGRKNIIYGHNGDTNLLDVPFNDLENYYDEEYYKEHQYVYLEDSDGVGTYQIFSVYVETRDANYMYLNFKNDSAWNEHINYLKNKSLYDTNVDVDATDDVLILQTCSHNEDYIKYKDKYLLVVAKRVRYE